MSAIVRIHRGVASPERVVMLGQKELGHLAEEVNDFEVPPGKHVMELRLGMYHSLPTLFMADEGEVLEFTVVENPDAILPVFLGGAIKLERYPKSSDHAAK